MTFRTRRIDVSFQLPSGSFISGPGNTLKLSGLNCTAKVTSAGGDSLSTLELVVYGMAATDINQLITFGRDTAKTPQSSVVVSAGDDAGMTQLFQGTLSKAVADYSKAPDVALTVTAAAGYYEQIKPAAVNSYKGPTEVATIIAALARSIDYAFINHGVTARLASPYLAGSVVTQIRNCARHAGIFCDISNGSVEIWPANGSRGSAAFLISPQTGLIGYPVLDEKGMTLTMEFNPNIQLGRTLEVQSSLPQACGKGWYCKTVTHTLNPATGEDVDLSWSTTALLSREVPNATSK